MLSDIELYDDAWVFLIGGNNSVGDYFIRKNLVEKNVVSAWNELLRHRKEKIEALGSKYVHLVAPEKINIYPEKTSENVCVEYSPAAQIEKGLDSEIRDKVWVNPVNYLRKQKKDFLVYSKTDSHWNFYGAFCAYQMLQSSLGESFNSSILENERKQHWTTMDLGGKFDPVLKEKVYFYTLSKNVERIDCNQIVEFKEKNQQQNEIGLHIGSFVSFENKQPLVDKCVLIFGDSFSEYRGHLVTGLLAETYRTVHFIWSSALDYSMVEKIKPDIVISELAERFMPTRVPKDNFDLRQYETETLARLN